jgi:DedD protein
MRSDPFSEAPPQRSQYAIRGEWKMSAENKKLVWIAVAVCVFVLVLAVAGIFFFAPKKGAALAPATVGNTAAPKAADPQDYLSAPAQALPTEAAPSKDGDVIVIYGNNPQSLAPTLPPDAAGQNGSATAGAAAGAAPGQAGQSPASGAAGLNAAAGNASAGNAAVSPAAAVKAPATAQTKPAATKPAAKATASKAVAKAATKAVDEYWIQAASFTSRGKADDLKDSLAKQGMASIITVKDIDGKSWYRVRIGPYATPAEAKGWLDRIKTLAGCEEAAVWKSVTKK